MNLPLGYLCFTTNYLVHVSSSDSHLAVTFLRAATPMVLLQACQAEGGVVVRGAALRGGKAKRHFQRDLKRQTDPRVSTRIQSGQPN